jgi:hypothetical protein
MNILYFEYLNNLQKLNYLRKITTCFAIFIFPFILDAQYTAIPDVNFEQKLIDLGVDTVLILDGQILTVDAEAQTFLDVSNSSISNLTGIEAFVNLTALRCEINSLSSIDITNNTALTFLWCYSNSITNLNVTNNLSLTDLRCGYNLLTSLDVTNNTVLDLLWCNGNSLSNLDVSNNTALTWLDCTNNPLTSLDVTNNTALTHLGCTNNSLSNLDVTNNTMLIQLTCHDNSLTVLDVSSNTALSYLGCSINSLTNLDVTNNTALTGLICRINPLTSLDVTNNTALSSLSCRDNLLTSLDVSNNLTLTHLYCHSNSLTSLDVSNNTALTHLWCDGNALSSLNVKNGNNTNITNDNFQAQNNPSLTCIDVDDDVWSTNNWFNIDPGTDFSVDCAQDPSPVELVIFRAYLEDKAVYLNWQTASESNNEGFEVQWAASSLVTSELRWEVLGFVPGSGNSSELQSYSYLHRRPSPGVNYYRLKQIDYDGAFEYSSVVSVEVPQDGNDSDIQVFPNPVHDGQLNVVIPESKNVNKSVHLYDQIGRAVLHKSISENNTILSVSKFPAGIYFLEVVLGTQVLREKVIIR